MMMVSFVTVEAVFQIRLMRQKLKTYVIMNMLSGFCKGESVVFQPVCDKTDATTLNGARWTRVHTVIFDDKRYTRRYSRFLQEAGITIGA